jgi:hypothetical protein
MDRMSKAPAEGRVAHLASIWQVIDRCLREVDDELKDLYPSLSFLEVVGYEVGPVLYAISDPRVHVLDHAHRRGTLIRGIDGINRMRLIRDVIATRTTELANRSTLRTTQ